jgi:hypothetical protein
MSFFAVDKRSKKETEFNYLHIYVLFWVTGGLSLSGVSQLAWNPSRQVAAAASGDESAATQHIAVAC